MRESNPPLCVSAHPQCFSQRLLDVRKKTGLSSRMTLIIKELTITFGEKVVMSNSKYQLGEQELNLHVGYSAAAIIHLLPDQPG